MRWPLILMCLVLLSGCAKAAGETARLRVPQLVGMELGVAQKETQELGLVLFPSGLTAGSRCRTDAVCRIYTMSPAAGARVAWGSRVKVKFLTTTETAFYHRNPTMPKLTGRSSFYAAALLDPVIGLVYVSADPEPRLRAGVDRVMTQVPEPGAPLAVGERIKLTIRYNRGDQQDRFCARRWWC
ncbi:hypothetical protein OIE66_07520 [Nonomuraea sp. NBC_01738]|uniref:PASTA domain-containing protein n=1 Tax=Nonomuraea sp. NBC_01738 TaxID=2976003 RepID=UPI002E12C81C|nr:hypothetical protein OIE66_07520 [Nonomuraea sp. NBC_01738]